MDQTHKDTSQTIKISALKSELTKVLKTISDLESQQKASYDEMIEKRLVSLTQRTGIILDGRMTSLREKFNERVKDILTDFDYKSRQGTKQIKKIIRGESSEEIPIKPHLFIEKVHKKQSAPISKLLYSPHFQTIYNIFMAILVNFGVAELAKD